MALILYGLLAIGGVVLIGVVTNVGSNFLLGISLYLNNILKSIVYGDTSNSNLRNFLLFLQNGYNADSFEKLPGIEGKIKEVISITMNLKTTKTIFLKFAVSLLVILFLVQVIKEITDVKELINLNKMSSVIMKLCFSIVFVRFSYEILDLLAESVVELFNIIRNTFSGTSISIYNQIDNVLKYIADSNSFTSPFENIGRIILLLIFIFASMGVIFTFLSVLIKRLFKLMVSYMFAPIFFTLMIFDEYRRTSFEYMKKYFFKVAEVIVIFLGIILIGVLSIFLAYLIDGSGTVTFSEINSVTDALKAIFFHVLVSTLLGTVIKESTDFFERIS